jgi:hypothetical protein
MNKVFLEQLGYNVEDIVKYYVKEKCISVFKPIFLKNINKIRTEDDMKNFKQELENSIPEFNMESMSSCENYENHNLLTSNLLKPYNESKLKDNYYTELINFLENKDKDKQLSLLKDIDILKWLHNDLSFLQEKNKSNEDAWGKNILQKFLNRKNNPQQWTNLIGEDIAKELCILLGENICKKTKLQGLNQDFETDNFIIEAKTGTFLTHGTAHEKIMGTPFKYAECPKLYKKPVIIICSANAEKFSIEKGLLYNFYKDSVKYKFTDFFRENNIYFAGVASILYYLFDKNKIEKYI